MNKMKRLDFCRKALSEKKKFENIIFTDETSVQIEQHARICFRKDGSQPKRKVRISLNVMLSSLSFSVDYRVYKKKVIELQRAIAPRFFHIRNVVHQSRTLL
jgi:hypothetical protein